MSTTIGYISMWYSVTMEKIIILLNLIISRLGSHKSILIHLDPIYPDESHSPFKSLLLFIWIHPRPASSRPPYGGYAVPGMTSPMQATVIGSLPPIAGWFLLGKIPSINGWGFISTPMTMETPISFGNWRWIESKDLNRISWTWNQIYPCIQCDFGILTVVCQYELLWL